MVNTYNLVLNSSQYYSKTNNNNVTYNIDWSFLPHKKFKCSFNFHSTHITNLTANSITQVIANIDGLQTTYSPLSRLHGGTGYSQYNLIGVARPVIVGTVGVLQSSYLDNPTFMLQSRPNSSLFNIQLCDILGAQTGYNFNANEDYILIIQFVEID